MTGNPMGQNGMVRPGPSTGSPFAGGSFSPRRRSTAPTPGVPSSGASQMPGQRNGWDGQSLPPGLYAKQQAGQPLPGPFAGGGAPAPQAPPMAAPAVMPIMPKGSMPMPGMEQGGEPYLPYTYDASMLDALRAQQVYPAPAPYMPPPPPPQSMAPGQMMMRPGMGRRIVMPNERLSPPSYY